MRKRFSVELFGGGDQAASERISETALRQSQRTPAEKPRVQSAARTVGIILAIGQSRDGLQAKEITEMLKLPRQVTYHLLHTLSATGIICRNAQHRYTLGLAAAPIADGFSRQFAPLEHLVPRVRAIAEECGETAYASGWVGGEIAVLATARGNAPIQAAEVPRGYSEDPHARASGKLLLALAERSVRDAYLAGRKLKARTAKTITSAGHFRAELERIHRRGYAIDEEEFYEGVCCLAVPLAVLGGRIVFSISVPAERFHVRFEHYLANLRRAAKDVLP